MSFRVRVVIIISLAVSLAVVIASAAAYVSSRHAVMQAVDDSLLHTARGSSQVGGEPGEDATRTLGAAVQIILADGSQIPSSSTPPNPAVLAIIRHQAGRQFLTVSTNANTYRELVVPLPRGTTFRCAEGFCTLNENGGMVFSADITGQRHQLSVLGVTLIWLSVFGVALAALLAYLAAITALRPLESVTDQIEAIANTSDVRARLDEGGKDELGRLRRVFNRLLVSIESSQRLQRQLVMDASHELRTPLTSLRTNAQVLQNIDRLESEDRQLVVADMLVQVDELASLVGDLAELARGEGHEGDVESVNLTDLIEEAVSVARTHARTKDITITLEPAREETYVLVRRSRLVRAINNLLGNAIKFTPVGGTVAVTCQGGVVEVADSGPGVPDVERAYVFDRFWRSPSARSLPGSGLGLAIVAQVVNEAGGTVRVDTADDLGGARFTVTLPVSTTRSISQEGTE